MITANLAVISDRISWIAQMGWLVEKGNSSKVLVVVEGDEIRLVAAENLHGVGSTAVIVMVCYRKSM